MEKEVMPYSGLEKTGIERESGYFDKVLPLIHDDGDDPHSIVI